MCFQFQYSNGDTFLAWSQLKGLMSPKGSCNLGAYIITAFVSYLHVCLTIGHQFTWPLKIHHAWFFFIPTTQAPNYHISIIQGDNSHLKARQITHIIQ